MSATATVRFETFAQAAIKAWHCLEPAVDLTYAAEGLKETTRSQVYRISCTGGNLRSVIAKRRPPATVSLELALYTELLPSLNIPTVQFLGSVEETGTDYRWMFFDDAGDRELDRDDPAHQALLADWAARLHAAGAHLSQGGSLPDAGPSRYLDYLQRTRLSIDSAVMEADQRGNGTIKGILRLFDTLEIGWSHIERCCGELAATIVHGHLVPKNLRLCDRGNGLELVSIDWEAAGWGTPACDLAAIDAQLYCATAQKLGLTVDTQAVVRLRKLGRLFRWLAALSWAATRLQGEGSSKALSDLEACRDGLWDALCVMKWKLSRRRGNPPPAPDGEEIARALSTVLEPDRRSSIDILERKRNLYSSTFPSEVLNCRLPDGAVKSIHCKYESGLFQNVGGHRSGPSYEAAVYERLLRQLPITVPQFLGSTPDQAGRGLWLFTEFITEGQRLDDTADPATALTLAARWAGEFHAISETRLSKASVAFINRYTADYYGSWADRTAEFAGQWHTRASWLNQVCLRAKKLVIKLAAAPVTVIHGEFTPHNVLLRGDTILPIDWESAAIAPGEIDLASLTDGWPEPIAKRCEDEYCKARWPHGRPQEFHTNLELARLYWNLRWLGNRPDWLPSIKLLERIEYLRAAAERMRWI